MTSSFEDLDEFNYDYLFIKFTNLPYVAAVAWSEVAGGTFVPDESSEDTFVFLTKIKEDLADEPAETSAPLVRSPLKKDALIRYLDTQLREPSNPNVVDYGPVLDFRIQPAGRDMTKDVFMFLAKHRSN